MNLLTRVLQSLRPAPSPSPGRLLAPRPQDSIRDYPGAGLTPARLAAILREADGGSLSTAMALFEEMEEKDAHLYAIANTRRLALTGLEWQVVSAADIRALPDRAAADAAADYCREILAEMDSFEDCLQHLALALGRNIAVSEILWDQKGGRLQPVDIVPVDFSRIQFDELDHVRILTAEDEKQGISPPPYKFIIHTPQNVSGHPQRGGLLRVTAMIYLAKNLSLKDWLIFAEIFGMPVRIARYEPSASAEEKRELLHMLEGLGANAAGIFSRAVELQIIDANRGTAGPPYESLIEFLNREMSKAWLGQTLTTDITGQSGSIAASKVHEQVRRDLLLDDIRKEARTLRRDLLAPMTVLRFGPDVPVPYFRRRIGAALDRRELAEMIGLAVNELGLQVPSSWACEVLDIPQITQPTEFLPGKRP